MLLFSVALLGVNLSLRASEVYPPKGWETDFQTALNRAAAEDKYILVDFTGSDWCGWCIRLDAEVFGQSEFKKFAEEKLVLLYIDSPSKIELPAALVAQNRKLGQVFQVQGYPTVVLLRKDSTPALVSGYRQGGPAGYIKHLKEAMTGEADVSDEVKLQWIEALEEAMGVKVAARPKAPVVETAATPDAEKVG